MALITNNDIHKYIGRFIKMISEILCKKNQDIIKEFMEKDYEGLGRALLRVLHEQEWGPAGGSPVPNPLQPLHCRTLQDP